MNHLLLLLGLSRALWAGMMLLHKFLGKSLLLLPFLGALLPNRVFSFTLATITSAFDPDFHFLKLVPSCHGTARVLKISRVVKEKGVSGTIHG
ncbi:hypothetical protein QR685DRAFT_537177 [Neurospora intermedia]|uniref:Secreted protein n=1 Tax=Neurospora intermedia TaxID=5142 RepID=A0ABR3CZ21_NEUIN